MNALSLLTKTYAWLHNYPSVPYWVLTPFRKIVRGTANIILPYYLARPHKKRKIDGKEIIVSFTSFPARINNVWQVVECMLRQTYLPSKIILWLSKKQFPNFEDIPYSLREREDELFEIRMVEGDIRSHKKYYYAVKEYPNSLIFLIDDDIYYPTDIIARTMKAHKQHPNAVICNYGYHIGYTKEGDLLPYCKWEKEYYYSEASDLFFGSGGGTLLNPSLLRKELTNITKAIDLTPTADDIWLNAVVKLNNKRIILLKNGPILPIRNPNNQTLSSINRNLSQNDTQYKAVWSYINQFNHDTSEI